MKMLLILIISSSMLVACGDAGQKDSHNHSSTQAEIPAATKIEPSVTKHTLTLNNGAKWKSDESTNLHASAMISIVDDHKSAGDNKLEALHSTGKKLQDQVNLMVKECKMKGADHDALHAWLEPLMKMVKELNEAKDEASAAAILNSIDEQVVLYNDYFA